MSMTSGLPASKMLHDAHLFEARRFSRWRRKVCAWWIVVYMIAAVVDVVFKQPWPSVVAWIVGTALVGWLDGRSMTAYDRAHEISVSVGVTGLKVLNQSLPGIWE